MIPGAKCQACGKSNHNVYSTGCPSLAIYANCKAFHDATPKAQLEPIKAAFEAYQAQIRKKMKERRNADRRVLRAVASELDEEDMNTLQEKLLDEYKNDFQEEQYLDTNPFATWQDETE